MLILCRRQLTRLYLWKLFYCSQQPYKVGFIIPGILRWEPDTWGIYPGTGRATIWCSSELTSLRSLNLYWPKERVLEQLSFHTKASVLTLLNWNLILLSLILHHWVEFKYSVSCHHKNLGSNPCTATKQVCIQGQVISLFWARFCEMEMKIPTPHWALVEIHQYTID